MSDDHENANRPAEQSQHTPQQPPPQFQASQQLPPTFWRPSMEFLDWMPFSDEFAEKVSALETILGREVWLLVESDFRLSVMDPYIATRFRQSKPTLPTTPIAILLDSGGGSAEAAYMIASMLRRRCGGFTAVIPRLAKSAATLFALGADEIIMGEDAELGPLDVQFPDNDVEEKMVSALDTVQAVEQLEQNAMDVAVKMLKYLANVTRKKHTLLIEHALRFSAEITQPLFSKIDSVRYSRQQRQLREAQDYAERLLQPRFRKDAAKAIAKDLVREYPTHEFVIDRDETKNLGVVLDEKTDTKKPAVGLHVRQQLSPALSELLDWFSLNLSNQYGVGRLEAQFDAPNPSAP